MMDDDLAWLDEAYRKERVFALFKPVGLDVTLKPNLRNHDRRALADKDGTSAAGDKRRHCFADWVTELAATGDGEHPRLFYVGTEFGVASGCACASSAHTGRTSAPTPRASPAATTPNPPRHRVTGRLDKLTSGLILVTSDGALCAALCTPGAVAKTYIATVRAVPSAAQVRMRRARRRAALAHRAD